MPQPITRRGALTGLAAAPFAPRPAHALDVTTLGAPLGLQALPIRRFLARDFLGTLRVMRAMGYGRIELASFPGMVGNFRGDFSPLEQVPPAEVRQQLLAADLPCETCHFLAEEFVPERWPATLAWARGVGVKTMVYAGGEPPEPATPADLSLYFDTLNAAGERVRAAGMRMMMHTYAAFWQAAGSSLLIDQFIARVDPEHCQIQFDLGSVSQVQADPIALIRRYGPRIGSIHLRDGKKPADPHAYFPALPLGEGEVDLAGVVRAGRQASVRDYVVEMQLRPLVGVLDAYKSSIDYLRSLPA